MARKQDTGKSAPEVSGIAAAAVAGAVRAGQSSADSAAAYWKEHYRDLPSIPASATYDQYAPAFEYGWESRGSCCAKPPAAAKSPELSFDAAESDLRARWQQRPAAAVLSWDLARDAVRAAWDRVEQAIGSEEPKPSAR